MDKNILGRWLKIETASQTYNSIHKKQRLSTSSIGQPVSGKGRPPQAIPSPISRHNYMLRPISRIQIHSYIYIYIYTRTNYHKCPSQTRGRQEETHCPSHRFRCLFLYLNVISWKLYHWSVFQSWYKNICQRIRSWSHRPFNLKLSAHIL